MQCSVNIQTDLERAISQKGSCPFLASCGPRTYADVRYGETWLWQAQVWTSVLETHFISSCSSSIRALLVTIKLVRIRKLSNNYSFNKIARRSLLSIASHSICFLRVYYLLAGHILSCCAKYLLRRMCCRVRSQHIEASFKFTVRIYHEL